MPIVRRLLRWIAGLVVVLVVLIVALLVFSQTATFRDWLRGQVVTRVNETLAGRIALGRIEGNLLTGLELRDLRVTLDGVRVLAVRRITAGYDLLQLVLTRKLVLHDARIDGLALQVIQDERGWNVARLVKTEEEQERQQGSSTEIVIEDLQLHHGALRVIRPTDLWRVRGLNLGGDLAVGGPVQRVHVAGLAFDLPGRGVRLEKLVASVEVGDDGSISADEVSVRTAGSEISGRARVGRGDAPAYDAALTITRLSVDELRRLLGPIPLRVDVAGTVRAKGPASAVVVDVDVATAAGSVALDGTVDVASKPQGYDLHASVQHVDAATLLGPTQPATDVTGVVSVKGRGTTFEEAAATFGLALERSVVAGHTIERAAVDGSTEARRVRVTASAATAAGAAEAAGTVDVPAEHYDVRLTATDFDPAPFLNRPDLASRVNGTVTVAGTGFTVETARAEAHVELRPSRIQSLDVREARVDARADRGRLTVERLLLRANAVQATASGEIGLAAGTVRDASLRYELQASDLRPIATIAGVGPLAGSLRIAGTAGGSLQALTVDATVEGRQLARDGTTVAGLDAKVTAAAIGSPTAHADVTARATGVRAGGQAFREVTAKVEWAQRAAGSSAASFDVRAAGLRDERHAIVGTATVVPGETRVELTTLRADVGGDTWTATGRPVLVERGGQYTIDDLALRSPRGVVRAAGRAGTTGAQDLTLDVDGLELATLRRSVGEGVSGRITAHAHLGGTAAAPRVDADATITGPVMGEVRYESIRAAAQIGGGRATVNAQVVQAGPRQLALDAAVPVKFALQPFAFEVGNGVNGTARATAIDLAFLDPLIPQVSKLSGTLDADLTIGGKLAAPDIRGPISITGGRAYVVPVGLTYDPIELRARIDGQAASVETVRIVSGGGTLAGGGNARLENGTTTIDVRVELTEFPLFANQYGRGAASGWMWISGTNTAPVVEGSLTTNGLVLQIPEALPGSVRPPDPTITVVGPDAPVVDTPVPLAKAPESGRSQPSKITVVPASAAGGTTAGKKAAGNTATTSAGMATATGAAPPEEEPAPPPSVFDDAAITLQIDVPRNAWIRRSDANIELRGWMTVWKKPAAPLALSGEINAVRGWYQFQGKTFNLAEGQVTFTGQDLDPLLNLVATHKAGEYTARVIVGGRMTKPTLTLESDPPLDQADILSVILFGKPASELNNAESKGLREQAIGVAGSYVASQLRQSVANALGVDNLEFDTGGGGLSDAKVSLGKYVAEDIFVSLSSKFGREAVQEIRIEYTFLPNWSLETSTDTAGNSGADVFWKLRY